MSAQPSNPGAIAQAAILRGMLMDSFKERTRLTNCLLESQMAMTLALDCIDRSETTFKGECAKISACIARCNALLEGAAIEPPAQEPQPFWVSP